MALFKKQIDFSAKPFLEFIIVSISMMLILVATRIISRMIFGDEWIVTIGLISAVLGTILFFSKKGSLGIFGQMFIRQITKNHKGKRKWIMYLQMSVFLSVGILTIFSIHMGNNEYQVLRDQVIGEFKNRGIVIDASLNYDSIREISSQITFTQQMESIAALPILTIQDFRIFSVVLAVSDQMLGGWVMYFWQIVIIESIEVIIFLGITRKILMKNN